MTTPKIIATIALDTEPAQRGELYWQSVQSSVVTNPMGTIRCRHADTGEDYDTGVACAEDDAEETIVASWGERGTKGEHKVWDLQYV